MTLFMHVHCLCMYFALSSSVECVQILLARVTLCCCCQCGPEEERTCFRIIKNLAKQSIHAIRLRSVLQHPQRVDLPCTSPAGADDGMHLFQIKTLLIGLDGCATGTHTLVLPLALNLPMPQDHISDLSKIAAGTQDVYPLLDRGETEFYTTFLFRRITIFSI